MTTKSTCDRCGTDKDVDDRTTVDRKIVHICPKCNYKLSQELKKVTGRFFGLSRVEKAMKEILGGLSEEFGVDLNDENFRDTPHRVARAYYEIFEGMANTKNKVEEILGTTFPAKYDEMVMVGPVDTWSVCPHHFLPVEVRAWVGYVPNGKMLGLSKLARLVQTLAAAPLLQEKLTTDITGSLMGVLQPKGAACLIKARHLCMAMRGAKSNRAWTKTSSLTGVMLKKPEARAEFFALVNSGEKG